MTASRNRFMGKDSEKLIKPMYTKIGVQYLGINAEDEEGYPVLENHADEVRNYAVTVCCDCVLPVPETLPLPPPCYPHVHTVKPTSPCPPSSLHHSTPPPLPPPGVMLHRQVIAWIKQLPAGIILF